MIKELLEKQQPVVYRALNRACRDQRISSAYLFTGPYGTPKYETAVLLAQSILCEKGEGLACEECNTCRRVREGLYADMIILDGRTQSISKEMIDGIQSQFSETALEQNGQRVYIIRNAENATISAQNSMLKFLEEPGPGVTAILTTDNAERILPTIQSRCTILQFTPMAFEDYFKMAADCGVPEDDAYFLAHIAKTQEDMDRLYPEDDGRRRQSKEFANAVLMLKQYLNLEGMERNDLLVDFEVSYRSKESDASKAKASNLILIPAFLDLLSLYAHDVIRHDAGGPSWYRDEVMHAKGSDIDYGKLIMIIAEEKDRCNRFNDLNLLLGQAFMRLEEFNNDHHW